VLQVARDEKRSLIRHSREARERVRERPSDFVGIRKGFGVDALLRIEAEFARDPVPGVNNPSDAPGEFARLSRDLLPQTSAEGKGVGKRFVLARDIVYVAEEEAHGFEIARALGVQLLKHPLQLGRAQRFGARRLSLFQAREMGRRSKAKGVKHTFRIS
jgi:hypothetical protein